MGIVALRRVADLGPELALAPERHDPRRRVAGPVGMRLGELVEVGGETVAPAALDPDVAVLVLDTSHAREGHVFAWHAPVSPAAVGSAKRRLAPGDVIVSRLRPYLRQIAYVDAALFSRAPRGNPVLASTEFFVLRSPGEFDAAALVAYLLTAPVQAALAAAQEGGHHPRVSREALASLAVPRSLVRRSHELGERVRALAASTRASLDAGRSLIAELERQLKPRSRPR